MATLHKPFTNPASRAKRAIAIEDLLIWAYRDVRIDAVIKSGAMLAGPSGFNVAGVWALGTAVDGGGRRGLGFSAGIGIDDDALRVHGAVCDLAVVNEEAAAVVVMYARAGTEPEWHGVDAEQIVPVMKGQRFAMDYDDSGKRAVACLVRPRVDPELVRFSRWQWSTWVEALDMLADEMAGRLDAYELNAEIRNAEPWKTAQTGTAAIDEVAA